MKANSRRRVLISSLAMLLVALVALSTATFAWFSTNTTATANGLNVKTVKQSNLLIKKNGGSYGTLVDYKVADKVLLPASTTTFSSWFTAEADTYNSTGVKDGSIESAKKDTNYIADGLHILNDGSVACNNVTVTISWGDQAVTDYVRVALVKSAEDGTTLTAPLDAAVFSDTAGETYQGMKTATEYETVTTEDSLTLNVGDLAAGEEAHYALFVWFEGQDADCIDTNAGQEVTDIVMTVTGTPAA